ncbi:hypothetical protein O181_115554 [Austropuccinia psidii MF-1]|uniref:Uncharacterized protein n=1 Tax=Austropuccinia psidii MF-1 TaxID=1389203 RepID=A0A9Q3PVQ2_9BASI|nr:hypothetical protein [Austropuccinia psidii MF-1]
MHTSWFINTAYPVHPYRGFIFKGERERLGEVGDKEGEESVEEQDSGEPEVADALENASEVPQSYNIALSNKLLVSQTEPSVHNMIAKMTQFIGKPTQEGTPRGNSKAPEFKTPEMKAPDSFDGTQTHKLRGFI